MTGKCRLPIKPQFADDSPGQAVAFQNMDLGLELFIETETAASKACGDVTHVQSIRTFRVDRQVGDGLVAAGLHDTIERAQKEHDDERSDDNPSTAPQHAEQDRRG